MVILSRRYFGEYYVNVSDAPWFIMQTVDAVSKFINTCVSRNLSLRTIKWYREILFAFANKYPELPSDPELIESFIASVKVGDERRHGYYRSLRAFYHFLNKRLGINDPMECIEAPRRKPKIPRILMPQELNILLSYPHQPQIKTALMFLIDTGCRIGELHSLTLNCLQEIPWGHMAMVNGKTGQRMVPISYEVYHALMVNLPYSYSSWWLGRLISRAFKKASLRGSALTLRHTFGTLWEGDELVLQNIMGHASLNTTKRYRHLRLKTITEQHNKFSPLQMVFTSSKNML
jgi:integrase/recombinase XerD